MKKLNTSPISGMQELLPAEQAVFNKYKESIREVYHRHGFLEIETPTIDRAEILFAKAGGETEKQIYKVIKTDEAAEDADQALRFDHTVPLARYVAEHESDLNFPFKVTQIGRNFRGERAQKGRFREFYQCDIDVIGRNRLAPEYDVEIILTLMEALLKIIEKGSFVVRISNRKIISAFLEEYDLKSKENEIFSIIDHAEKETLEETRNKLFNLDIDHDCVGKLLYLINIHGEAWQIRDMLAEIHCNSRLFDEGKRELLSIMDNLESLLNALSFDANFKVIADLKIVRGLDYYTGTVFETFSEDYPEIGSVCSGGRYENLAGLYTDLKLPGVGGSIGLTRLYSKLKEMKLIEKYKDDSRNKLVDYAIIPVGDIEEKVCFYFANLLRKKDNSVDIIWTNKQFSDKMDYAAKIARYGIVIGEKEISTGDFIAKDFATGEKKPFVFQNNA